MDGIRGSRVLEIGLVGAIGLAAFIALSFVMPAFGHPIALALAPLVAVGVYLAAGYPWRPWQLVAVIALVAVLLVPFLISPSYLQSLF